MFFYGNKNLQDNQEPEFFKRYQHLRVVWSLRKYCSFTATFKVKFCSVYGALDSYLAKTFWQTDESSTVAAAAVLWCPDKTTRQVLKKTTRFVLLLFLCLPCLSAVCVYLEIL